MKRVLLDLDGVLVDFVGPSLALHGKSIPPADVRWNFPQQVGIPEPEFWRPLGFDFWSNLPWTTEGKQLLHGVRLSALSYGYITSPCGTEGCVEGKRAWARKNLPCKGSLMLVGGAKHLLAHPNALLIDDHDANVEKFREHGGKAILVPRPWNARKDECNADGTFDVDELLRSVTEFTKW